MSIRIVQSRQNSRLKELRRALRPGGSADEGVVAIEGPNLLDEAMRARLRIRCVFAAQGAEHLLEGMRLPADIELLLMPRELLSSALATETPKPVAALIEPPQWTWADLLPDSPRQDPLLVVLCGLQDPGNLGTILRSAEAFGANGVISLPGTVSAWNQKSVRASAGSVFRVPQLRMNATDCFARLQQAGIQALASKAHEAQSLSNSQLTRPVALLIGNEGSGLSADLESRADGTIMIPCPGPVESLNAAVAASVLLYESARQRGLASRRGSMEAR